MALAALVGLVGSCSFGEQVPVSTHVDGEGPLSLNLGEGSGSMPAPETVNWTVTFGGAVMCTTTGEPVELISVEYSERTASKSVTSFIRTVPPTLGRAENLNWYPLEAKRGGAADFQKSPIKLAGKFSSEIDGTMVTNDCSSTDGAFRELLTVMEVGPGGGWIDGIDVAYVSAGQQYRYHSSWNYIACGKETDC